MATTTTSPPASIPALKAPVATGLSERRRIMRLMLRNRMAMFGLAVVVLWIVIAALSPWIAPYDPVDQDLKHRLNAPSALHWFGVDGLGRDVFSRVLYGGRVSLPVAAVVVIVAAAFGTVYGGLAGFLGK